MTEISEKETASQILEWVGKPENAVTIDDCFYIKPLSWGSFLSVHKDGSKIITSLTEEQCIAATRWYLKAAQEGFPEDILTYDGTVGGKL